MFESEDESLLDFDPRPLVLIFDNENENQVRGDWFRYKAIEDSKWAYTDKTKKDAFPAYKISFVDKKKKPIWVFTDNLMITLGSRVMLQRFLLKNKKLDINVRLAYMAGNNDK